MNSIAKTLCYIRYCSFKGDTLGGHLDDMEADWSKPIVSMRYFVNVHVNFKSYVILLGIRLNCHPVNFDFVLM